MSDPRPAVFFDLDRTLISGSSVSQLGLAAWRAGIVDLNHMGVELARGLFFGWLGESGTVADQTLPRILKTIEGKQRSELMELLEPLLDQLLEQVRPETRRLLRLHLRMGRDCYIVSASAIEIVEPLAKKLGFAGALATEAEVVDGVYTGRLVEPFRHGAAKAQAIADLAAEQNYDLSLSFAYGDSHNDLPMLELVGIPITVNPDRALMSVAYDKGWPVVHFTRPHRRAIQAGQLGMIVAAAYAAGWLSRRSSARHGAGST
jgi:HAD superfamily hydrolase (TIGR01490 family)